MAPPIEVVVTLGVVTLEVVTLVVVTLGVVTRVGDTLVDVVVVEDIFEVGVQQDQFEDLTTEY